MCAALFPTPPPSQAIVRRSLGDKTKHMSFSIQMNVTPGSQLFSLELCLLMWPRNLFISVLVTLNYSRTG